MTSPTVLTSPFDVCAGNVNLSLPDPDGNTPLHLVVSRGMGSLTIFEALLSHSADQNLLNHHLDAPIHLSIPAIGSMENAEYMCLSLIKSGRGNVDIKDSHGATPLAMASQLTHQGIVMALLEAGADPEIVDEHLNTPLIIAASVQHMGIVGTLVKHGADVNCQNDVGDTALHAGLRPLPGSDSWAPEPVRLILSSGKCQLELRNKLEQCALATAAKRLWWAAEVVPLAADMVRQGADVNLMDKAGRAPLHYSLMERWPPGNGGEDSGDEGENVAAPWNSMRTEDHGAELALALIASRMLQPDVVSEDAAKVTALHLAAAKGLPQVSAALIASTADPNIMCGVGEVALHKAVWRASAVHDEVALQLVRCPASTLDMATKSGHQTAMLIGVLKGREVVVSALVEQGADPNIADTKDDVPLHAAVRQIGKHMLCTWHCY